MVVAVYTAARELCIASGFLKICAVGVVLT